TCKVGEQVILSAGLSWINYDLDTFKQHLPSLIEHFTYVSLKETLIGIEDEYPLLKTDTTCDEISPQKGRKPKFLLVVGGQIKEVIATRQCEFDDFSTDLWYVISSELPTRMCGAGVDVLNGHLYAVANRWIPFPSMEARRSTLGVCVVNNKIYAVGGYDGSTALQSAEYSIKSLAN
ncbi:Ring canal kelch like protein-like protein, partial [Dinothrombium tinctorium]